MKGPGGRTKKRSPVSRNLRYCSPPARGGAAAWAAIVPCGNSSILTASACEAHAVAATEIHWSWRNGKPLSKYGGNLIARLRTCHERQGIASRADTRSRAYKADR